MCSYNPLFAKLDSQTLVLAVNKRLAATLSWHYQAWLAQQGIYGVQGQRILSQQQWIAELWQQLRVDRGLNLRVLSATEEHWQWQQIIQHAINDELQHDTSKLASLAQSCWETLTWWQQTLNDVPPVHTEDTARFLDWGHQFADWCHHHNAISSAQCLQMLVADAPQLSVSKLILVGFDHVPALLQTWLDQSQLQVSSWDLPKQTPAIVAEYFDSYDHEIAGAVYWAWQQLQQHPEQKLAIVDPNLQANRSSWLRLLPGYDLTAAMSGGSSLADEPVIADALSWLKFDQIAQRDHWLRLIQSPFILGAADERTERAALACQIKACQPNNIAFAAISKLIVNNSASTPLLAQLVTDLAQLPAQPKTVSSWLDWLGRLLTVLGWPGSIALDSCQYQAVSKWYDCWLELGSWQLAGAGACRLALREVSTRALFQPESPKQPQLTILGMLESAGQLFDQIRVIGLTDAALPLPASPNPLLPIYWQRQLNMPRASSTREAEFAALIWQRWQNQCQRLLVSFPRFDGDSELGPSYYCRQLPVSAGQVGYQADDLIWKRRPQLEYYQDDYGLALSDADCSQVAGGASLFKSQALCPFQAYSRYRLAVRSVEPCPEYLSQASKGELLHKLLELFWEQMQSSCNLEAASQDPDALRAILQELAKQAVIAYQHRQRHLWHRPQRKLESNRLADTAFNWLQLERQRPGFTIASLEQKVVSQIAGLAVTLRIDRVDTLHDGSNMVLDYKTGQVTVNDLTPDKLYEPQLPLYSYCLQPAAVSFAVLRPPKYGFTGVADHDVAIKGIVTSLDGNNYNDLQQLWHQRLHQLAGDFKRGWAQVAPADPNKACNFCDLQQLCRIRACQ